MALRNSAVKELSYRVINTDNKAGAILTRIGFLSNAGDAAKLDTLAERQTAGKAIVEGIRSFVNTLSPVI